MVMNCRESNSNRMLSRMKKFSVHFFTFSGKPCLVRRSLHPPVKAFAALSCENGSLREFGIPDEDENIEPTNRAYWEKRSSKPMFALADALFGLVKEVEPLAEMNYNKYYIGIIRNKIAANFCSFKPKKAFVYMIFKPMPDDSLIQQMEDAELDAAKKAKWNELYIKFTQTPTAEQKDLLRKAIEHSRKAYGI